MKKNEFEKLFDEIAGINGFESFSTGWYKESSECIVILKIFRSYEGLYELKLKVFIQNLIGKTYSISDTLFDKEVCHFSLDEPKEYASLFDFNRSISDTNRINGIRKLFNEFIMPITRKVLSRSGIRELDKDGLVHLLPIIKALLG